jgi:hypothetical protein
MPLQKGTPDAKRPRLCACQAGAGRASAAMRSAGADTQRAATAKAPAPLSKEAAAAIVSDLKRELAVQPDAAGTINLNICAMCVCARAQRACAAGAQALAARTASHRIVIRSVSHHAQ